MYFRIKATFTFSWSAFWSLESFITVLGKSFGFINTCTVGICFSSESALWLYVSYAVIDKFLEKVERKELTLFLDLCPWPAAVF